MGSSLKALVPGSIVANKNFIAQFCTVTEGDGKCALDSVYVGAWTAVQSVGQIIGWLFSLGFRKTDTQVCSVDLSPPITLGENSI